MPVFRNVSDAQLAAQTRTFPRNIASLKTDLAGKMRWVNQSGQRFDQLGLAVSFDAGDAQNLALANFKRNIVDPLSASAFVIVRFLTLKRAAPICASGFSTRSRTSRPTISRASSAALVSFVCKLPTTLPSRITVTSSEIASTSASL